MTEPAPTLFFMDTEFIEDGHSIDLLSIGIVCEDGRELYLENAGADYSRAGDWVRQNVIPRLSSARHNNKRIYRDEIASRIRTFVGDVTPEFWGYFADYDWVVFCQLFGRMVDLPDGWPKFCMDLKQWAVDAEVERWEFPKQVTEHHALSDARWNKQVYDFLLAADDRFA